MKTTTMLFVIASALALAAIGCGNEAVDDGDPDTIDEVTKADSTLPIGNFAGTVKVGQIRDLTLNSDKSYSYFVQTVDCVPRPCRAVEGSYKYSHSSTTKYLRFYDADGNFTVRYAYKLSAAGGLSLKPASGVWFSLTKTNVATLGERCGGFTVNPKHCAEGLDCIAQSGPDIPGTCLKSTQNPCEAAGGDCVALYPGSCDGEVADARDFSCGGGLGVECCFHQ